MHTRGSRTSRGRPGRRSWIIAWALLATVLFGGMPPTAEAQEPPPPELERPKVAVNESYRLRLSRPKPGWTVFSGDDAAGISGDAILATTSPAGVTAVVIVEEAPTDDPVAMAQFIAESMPIQDGRMLSLDRHDWRGNPGARFDVVARVSGIRVRYLVQVVLAKGMCYQINMFGIPLAVSNDSFDAVLDAIELLEGDVRPGTGSLVSPDRTGVGWIVEDDVFRHGPGRLRVVRPAGWRLLPPVPESQLSPDATFGLSRSFPEVYFQVMSERVPPSSREGWDETSVGMLADGFGVVPTGVSREVEIAGVKTKLHSFEGEGAISMQVHVAAFLRGDVGYSVMAWHLSKPSKELAAEVDAALGSLHPIEGEQLDQLLADLENTPSDHAALVGNDVVRGRRYWNFEFGVSWEAPNPFWQIRVGDEARANNPYASATFVDLMTDMTIDVMLQHPGDASQEELHQYLFEGFDPSVERSATRRLKTAHGRALRTTMKFDYEGMAVQWEQCTLVGKRAAVNLTFTSITDDEAGFRARADAFLDTLVLDPELEAETETKAGFTDRRMGYSLLLLPSEWRMSDETPYEIRSIGSVRRWGDSETETQVFVTALMAHSPGAVDVVTGIMTETLGRVAASVVSEDDGVSDTIHIGGAEAERTTWKSDEMHVQMAMVTRGSRIYSVTVVAKPDAVKLTPERLLRGFRILD